MDYQFAIDPEILLATITELCMYDGKTREVAILASAGIAVEYNRWDAWNGGVEYYSLNLYIPPAIFSSVSGEIADAKYEILQKVNQATEHLSSQHIDQVNIVPTLVAYDESWRERADAWLNGSGLTNQGRVRSDNIASRECDGLLFRSEQEVNLYKAFKRLSIPFAPLPVFIRGGATYSRIEPDFIVIKDGVILMIEVDGDTVHRETPAEAHQRTTMLVHEGACLERVKASECANLELAKNCAQRLLKVIEKRKILR